LIAEIKEGRKTSSETFFTAGIARSAKSEEKSLNSSSVFMLPTQRVLAIISVVLLMTQPRLRVSFLSK
jgi:hypothetical protein